MGLTGNQKAIMYALGGVARGGATRGGYVDSRAYISIDGDQIGWARDDQAVGTLIGSLTVTDSLDESPNTCAFRVNGAVPEEGAELRITMGSKNRIGAIFAGYALTVTQRYAGIPRNVQADVAAVDYTWLLGFVKVTGAYQNQSGTAIANDLIARFAAVNGFTALGVAGDLPVLETITFTDDDLPAALTQLARRCGAYWYVDYIKTVHLFTAEPDRLSVPTPITPANKTFTALSISRDRTQGLTRVYVEGRGSRLLGPVLAGESILPLESVESFAAAPDVFLKVSYLGADAALHLNFSGVVPSPGGSLVGPGVNPSSPPALTPAAGTGIDAGLHNYAYTWVTAAGETRAGPIASVNTDYPIPPATVAPILSQDPPMNFPGSSYGSNYNIGVPFAFAYAYTKASSPTDFSLLGSLSPSAGAVPISNGDSLNPTMSAPIRIRVPYSTDPAVTWIVVFVAENYSPTFRYAMAMPNASGGGTAEFNTNGANEPSAAAAAHPGAAAAVGRIQLSAIAVGPSGTTARKLYRTRVGGGTLYLLTTIADNMTTGYLDAAADATLGAAAPAGDTSGLKSVEGVVNPGATSMPVASAGLFRAGGGWALVAEQVIRYSDRHETTQPYPVIFGIPASGIGSITGPIQYNTAIRVAPILTGIPGAGAPRSLLVNLSGGDEVYAVTQVDDPARQAQLAADLNVPSGVREEWIQDRRLSIPEARARGLATLASRALTAATLAYTTRDPRTATGLTIHVDLPAPTNILGDYKIQQVVWSNFRPIAGQPPTARVSASSRRFSLEDLLRIVKTKG